MTPEEYEKVHAVLSQLVDHEPAERDTILDSLCRDDRRLKAMVKKMLAHTDGSTFSLLDIAAPPSEETHLDAEHGSDEGLPTQIGPYRVLRRIGAGGMGTVYEAEQENPRRIVALKVVRPDVVSPKALKRLTYEAHVLGQIHHPHVAKVFDGGVTEQGRPYFVMELVEGIPITQYCDRNRLSINERIDLFILVCQAVQHAHQKGIIHRDLKPSNVLVECKEGKVIPKIIDFGIAKITSEQLAGNTFVTEQGQMIGTPAYMSPEQADPSNQDIDTRSDIYSLGVLLYELLTGSLPFDLQFGPASGLAEIQRIIREEEPPRPSTRLSDATIVSSVDRGAHPAGQGEAAAVERRADVRSLTRRIRGDLDWIVMKCLEKDRARRYETANGLVLDIRRHLENEVVLAGPPAAGYRLKKFLRRNKGAAAVVVALIVILSGGVVATTAMYLRAEAERERTIEARRQEQQAQRAAEASREVAEAVRNFLTEMLAEADPDRAKGKDVTVREVLDRAVERIKTDLADRPESEAAVRETIGNTYIGLRRFTSAEKQLRAALAIRLELFGDHHPDVATSMNYLAYALYLGGRIVESEQLLREALQLRHTLVDMGYANVVADSLRQLSQLVRGTGDPVQADSLMKESRGLVRE